MLQNIFNSVSRNPIGTILLGAAVALGTPFILPMLAPMLVAPAITLSSIFAPAALGLGTLGLFGPMSPKLGDNGKHFFLGGLGFGALAPTVAPYLAAMSPLLAAPVMTLATVVAPYALVIGGLVWAADAASRHSSRGQAPAMNRALA
jgi:hypothetical protein